MPRIVNASAAAASNIGEPGAGQSSIWPRRRRFIASRPSARVSCGGRWPAAIAHRAAEDVASSDNDEARALHGGVTPGRLRHHRTFAECRWTDEPLLVGRSSRSACPEFQEP